jgi:hypothetical protein
MSPRELLLRAPLGSIPRSEVPGPQFKGKIGPVVFTGTSTGTLTIGGFPIDVYPVVVKVVVGGDVGVAQLAVSLDGGATYDDPILTTPNAQDPDPNSPKFSQMTRWTGEIGITGITLLAINGSGTPNSFVAGDTWSFTTTASPKLLTVCARLSDFFRKWAENSAQKITDIDEADRTFLAHIGRVWLCSDRGDIPEHWMWLYKEAREHFSLESKGDIHLNSFPDPDSFVFPDMERSRGPFRFPYWRH